MSNEMEKKFSQSNIPSHFIQILRGVIGLSIKEVIRYSWFSAQEAIQPYKEDPPLIENLVFSYTAGPFLIKFDKDIALGFGYQPSLNSLSMWVEEDKQGINLRNHPLSTDPDLYPISATDKIYAEQFWHDVVGAIVKKISIIEDAFPTGKRIGLPNELGLLFYLNTGAQFVVSMNLCDSPDNFAVIPESQIKSSLRPLLKEIHL